MQRHVSPPRPRRRRALRLALAGAMLMSAACTSNYEEQCVTANDNKEMTVQGTFLRGSIKMNCGAWKRRHTDYESKGGMCPLPLFIEEGTQAKPILVFFDIGTGAGMLRPLPEELDWHKDIHIVTKDGDVQLGDEVKVTGVMNVRYSVCYMHASSVELLKDRYGHSEGKGDQLR